MADWFWILIVLLFLIAIFPPPVVRALIELWLERERLRGSLADAQRKLEELRAKLNEWREKMETLPGPFAPGDPNFDAWVDMLESAEDPTERIEEIERQIEDMRDRLRRNVFRWFGWRW